MLPFYLSTIIIFAIELCYLIIAFRFLNFERLRKNLSDNKYKIYKKRLISFSLIIFSSWFLCCILIIIGIIFPNVDLTFYQLFTTTLTSFQRVFNFFAYVSSCPDIKDQVINSLYFWKINANENNIDNECILNQSRENIQIH